MVVSSGVMVSPYRSTLGRPAASHDRWAAPTSFHGRRFGQLHRRLLAELHAADEPDWSRTCVDASHIRAKKGSEATGPSPVDRGKTGSEHHLVCDGKGTPFETITTAANVNDVTQTLAPVDGIPPVAGKRGRPRRRPPPCSATRGTTATPTAVSCASVASCR
ncbi:transposase [Streptomyces sp. DH37]|uniref:transposase n=1 Tax=Streptomyces sp. DH37 TaxID=3040122 RepID=UPI002440F8DA|nr:transposase [Streptomyces sp. DH37]MDG9702883.1 transposase [Streptomyces sp. DH37]